MQQVGAFLHLAACLGDRLAHFGHGEPGEIFLPAFEQVPQRGQHHHPVIDPAGSPFAIGARRVLQLAVDAVLVERFVFGDGLAGGRIGGGNHSGAPMRKGAA